ncbi:MAG TPA: hypothetical protein VHF69_07790, partial [Candidatus Synoicihabitans sp.]|nr:hypothetical protein [Candidatus Synoicihabitans sp.]
YGVQTGRDEYASEALTIARTIGAALIVLNDEWLPADAVAAIDRADARQLPALARGHAAYAKTRWYVPPDSELSFTPAVAAFAEAEVRWKCRRDSSSANGRSPFRQSTVQFVRTFTSSKGAVPSWMVETSPARTTCSFALRRRSRA